MRVELRLSSAVLLIFNGLVAMSSSSGPAFSQADAPSPSLSEAEEYFEVVDVEIVNIDVWVTDKKGQPVDGLEKDDFLVYRDGQPVETTNFYAVWAGRPVRSRLVAAAEAPTADPEASKPAPGEVPTDNQLAPEHRLWLIVYFDNFNVDAIERDRVIPALQHFLQRTLGPGDQAMVVTYDRALEVRQPFTDDIRLLVAATDELRGESGLAAVRRRDQVNTLELIDRTDNPDEALSYARVYAEEQRNSVDVTVDALQKLVETLAGLPGRKALIHVSSGVPMLAGEEMFYVVAERFENAAAYAEIPRHDTTRRFESVSRLANANRVVFHTLDAGGLRGMQFGAAEYGGFVNMSIRGTLDSVVPENLQGPLRLMADETGGRAILNRNEVLPALEEVARDFRSFYSLGISSSGGASARYHKIEVKLAERRKDLVLRHRAGYRSKSLESRTRDNLRAALLYAHRSNPLNAQVVWGEPELQEGAEGQYLLPIRLGIPLRDVVLLPTIPGKHEARLELLVGAVGVDGKASEIDAAPLGLRLADEHVEAAKDEALVHTHKLLLAPGRQKVGVAILDVFGSRSSVLTRIIQVGPVPGAGSG